MITISDQVQSAQDWCGRCQDVVHHSSGSNGQSEHPGWPSSDLDLGHDLAEVKAVLELALPCRQYVAAAQQTCCSVAVIPMICHLSPAAGKTFCHCHSVWLLLLTDQHLHLFLSPSHFLQQPANAWLQSYSVSNENVEHFEEDKLFDLLVAVWYSAISAMRVWSAYPDTCVSIN